MSDAQRDQIDRCIDAQCCEMWNEVQKLRRMVFDMAKNWGELKKRVIEEKSKVMAQSRGATAQYRRVLEIIDDIRKE